MNGHRGDKQNYICIECHRQFIDHYDSDGYSDDVKRLCIQMYVNGMGFRSMSRVTGIAHTSLLNWVKQVGEHLHDAYDPEEIPQVGELDELETFVEQRKNKVWIWTAVDHCRAGILGWVIGNHSAQTFQLLWQTIECWQCYFWVSDDNPVYSGFIPWKKQI